MAPSRKNVGRGADHVTEGSTCRIDGSVFRRQHQEGRKEEPGLPQGDLYGGLQRIGGDEYSTQGELGEEAHDHGDEILFIVEGKGEVILDGRAEPARRHDAIFVTAGQLHNLRNTGHGDLKLVAVYSPPPSGGDTPIHRAGASAVEEQMRHAWEQ